MLLRLGYLIGGILTMGLSLYLESQKQSIATSVAMQNAAKKRNPDSTNSFDNTDSCISIFSAEVRKSIRDKASSCNETSSQIVLKNAKNQDQVANSCSDVNSRVAELQSLISWAGTASQEIASIPGLSASAISAVNKNMSETMQFGSSLISNSIAQANEALSKINVPQNNQNQPLEAVVKTTQNNLNAVAQSATSTVNTGITATTDAKEASATTKPVETKTEAVKTEAEPVKTEKAAVKQEDVKIDNPFLTETKKTTKA